MRGDMTFYREGYSLELVAEMLPLLTLHHEETRDKFYGPLNPDLNTYELLQKAGALRIYTVRSWNGTHLELMGYQVFIVSTHPHSKEVVQAAQDILYLHPKARRGTAGYRFILWCGQKLADEGVHIAHQRISARHDFGQLLVRAGYELEDLTYSKNLQRRN